MSDAYRYRAAHVLITEYGREALSIASKRVKALADQDDLDRAPCGSASCAQSRN